MTFRKNPAPFDLKTTTVKITEVMPTREFDKLAENLLAPYVPASVVVYQGLEIFQRRGVTGVFLQHVPGKASANVKKIAHPSIVFELRKIIDKHCQSGRPVKKSGMVIKSGKHALCACIEALSITNRVNQRLFTVLFQEAVQNKVTNISGYEAGLNQPLQEELTAILQGMTAIIEGRLIIEFSSASRLASKIIPHQRLDYTELFVEELHKWLDIAPKRNFRGVAFTDLDITQFNEAEKQHDELNSKLKGSYEMIQPLNVIKEYVQQRGPFLRSTFHDLKGSFGIISGGISLLDQMETDEDRAKTLALIQRNLELVTQMMDQLLDYSRLESGEEKLHIGPFNASALLTRLCEGYLQIAKEKGLGLNCSGDDGLTIDGDQVKVQRIAQNLIINALKYTHKGGVTVSWQALASGEHPVVAWEFSITDTGIGIPQNLVSYLTGYDYSQDHLHQIDDLLWEVQDLEGGSGEGIGLLIVKQLCELLGAEMHVASHPDIGTAFRIRIPTAYPPHL